MQFSDPTANPPTAAVELVTSITKRPDRADLVKAAINRVIGNYATRGTFAHDLSEPPAIAIDATKYTQSLDLTIAPFVNFRKIKYLRPTGYTSVLKWRDPVAVFKGGVQAQDVWYMSGTNIIFNLCRLQSSILVGYYQYHSPLVNNSDTDWMLNLMWPAILDAVVGDEFIKMGEVEDGNRLLRNAETLFDMYRNDLKDGVSFA